MHLLLTLSCLLGTTLSTTPQSSDHQGLKEPKVAIDGYVDGYYRFLGHQLPAFLGEAHTAFSGIETANQKTGIHSTYPHLHPNSEAVAESSLLTNLQQAAISKESAVFAHQQENLKHNSVLGSSGSDLEVFGHGHIHLNPIVEKNVKKVFHIGNNQAGRVMESEKVDSLRDMGSVNYHQTNLYSETSSPYVGRRGQRVGFSQNQEGTFGIPIGVNQVVGKLLTKKEAGKTSSSIGLDGNIYPENQNSFTGGANYDDILKFNQANINRGTMTQEEKETLVPYPNYGRTKQASYFNSGLGENQVFTRNRNNGQANYEGSLQMSSPNQASGGVITQKGVENTVIDYPISYTSQLGFTDDRLHGTQGLKYHDLHLVNTNDRAPLRTGQANSAWGLEVTNQMNLNPTVENIEKVFLDGRSVNHQRANIVEEETVATLSNVGGHNSFQSNSKVPTIRENGIFGMNSVYNRENIIQNLHFSRSGNTGLVNADMGAEVHQKETKNIVITHPTDQTGSPDSFLGGNQGVVDQNLYLGFGHGSLQNMNQINNRKGGMIHTKIKESFLPDPNHDSQMDETNTAVHNTNVYVDEAANGKSYPNAGFGGHGGINYQNVYNHERETINQEGNQATGVSNPESSGVAKTNRKQDNSHLYISNNGYDGYTRTGQVNSEEIDVLDRSAAEKIKHDSSICKLNHRHVIKPSLDSLRNIVGEAGQEKSSFNPIVQENIKEVFTENKGHQGDEVQRKSLGPQNFFGNGIQIEYPNQNIFSDDGKTKMVYNGERQVDYQRGVLPSQGTIHTFPGYETMARTNLNQKIINRNLENGGAGSRIPAGIGLVRPTEAATAQEGIEIADVDFSHFTYPVGTEYGKIHHGEGQVDSRRGASPSQGITNTIPGNKIMVDGLKLNQDLANRNLNSEGAVSSISSGVGIVRPTEAAPAQKGIEISGMDSYGFTKTVNGKQYPDFTMYGAADQVKSMLLNPLAEFQTGKYITTNPELAGIGGIHGGLNWNPGMSDENVYNDQYGYRTFPKTSQLNTQGDTSRQEKTLQKEMSYPNYGRIDKISTGLGVNGQFLNQNQHQAEYGVFPSKNANGQFPIQDFNTGGYPSSDSNLGMFLQGGLYGKYPVQAGFTSQYPLWKTLNYNSENRPTAKYQQQFGPASQYPLQDGINGQYPPQSGFNVQYPPQNGFSSQYSPQGIIGVQYPPQVGFNSQYPLQNGPNIQYPLQNGPNFQYPSQGGLNVQYSLLYGQYGQYPLGNEKYLHSMLGKELPEGDQGLTSLSSRIKQDGPNHDSPIENVERKVEVRDQTISETETKLSDVTPESGNDHDGANPISIENTIKTVDETPDINGKTSQEYVSQIKANETSESNNDSLKFQTKETTQVIGDSQTIKFTIRLPPKVITKTITSLEKHTGDGPMTDENTIKTQQPEENKGIQIMIDSLNSTSNQGEEVSRVLDLSPRFGLEESSKPVDTSQISEHNIAEIETSNSSSLIVGIGDKTELDKIKEDNESVKSQRSGDYLTNKHEDDETLGISGASDNEGKLNNHTDEHVEIGVTKGTDISAGVKTTADGSSEVSKNIVERDSAHVLNLHYSKTDADGHTGGIDEQIRRSNEHGEIQVPDGGFNGLSVNNEVVHLSAGHGGVVENIIDLSKSKHNIDSTYGMGLNSILDPGNDKGLGVHIKYNGPDFYGTENLNSMKDHEVRIEDGINFHSGLNFGHGIGLDKHNRHGGFQITGGIGDHSRNLQKVELGHHHGHLHPVLNLARNLL